MDEGEKQIQGEEAHDGGGRGACMGKIRLDITYSIHSSKWSNH